MNLSSPFDFRELSRADHTGLPAPGYFAARDGARLAVRRYPADADLALIALHGSSGDGIYFHTLARNLAKGGVAAVYVPDLRGHGASAGRRGDVDYVGQLEDDLEDLIGVIRAERPGARVVLLGHSSGGGLAVRFAGGRRDVPIAGYVLLAPFLGAAAPTTRPDSGGWAKADVARIDDLAARAARGDVAGQDEVVLRFNKAPAQRTGREVLAYTFRMTMGYHPRPDLGGDLAAIRQPLLVLAGARDESFVPELYEPTIAPFARGTFRILPGLSHFGVVVDRRAIEAVAAWLRAPETNAMATAAGTAPAWVDRAAYPFALHRMRLAAGTVSYVDEGRGEPILFVHGTPTWSFEYRHLVRALSATHRCIAVDHLGFGLSERPADFAYTPEAHARVLAELVDRLGLESFTLVVHDFGGPIALPLALARPQRLRGLVLLNTWMWSLADDPALRRAARVAGSSVGRFLYRRFNFSLRTLMPQAYGDRRKLTREIHAQYLAPFPDADGRERVLWSLVRALLGSSAHFDSLWQRRARLAAVPALILWGMRDRALPPSLLARWREALPHARVVELQGAGHWPHEEAPDEVAARLKAFLDARP